MSSACCIDIHTGHLGAKKVFIQIDENYSSLTLFVLVVGASFYCDNCYLLKLHTTGRLLQNTYTLARFLSVGGRKEVREGNDSNSA